MEDTPLPPTLITDYERGKLRLYDEIIVKFSEALSVSTDQLLGRDDNLLKKVQANRKTMQSLNTIEELPEHKKKAILKTLDDLIRANS
jgi:predicted transcriptional regulator